ncbi:MAG: two-component system, cell cycle sensor histidine kinase and response regulator CckA [Acidobacteriota bacterium]|nr:two-component system, cell cycle sensor histidine kinase and response regulator CckA [Acidobacteriota bacterium]
MSIEESEAAVLIVNDSPDALALTSVVLQQAGYRVLAAADGLEGLALARRELPALIISDVAMPHLDGIELCRRLREDARLRLTPVLLVSARRKDSASALEGLRAGADDYLEAPFDPPRLVAQVARLMERARVEAHYRDIVEQANDIIYTHDLDGRLTSLNAAGLLFSRRQPSEDLTGQHVASVFRLESGEVGVKESIKRLRCEGVRREEAQALNANGERRWLEFNMSLICMRDGTPYGVRGVARDITGHKQIEERLRRSEERYRELVDNANDIVYTTDMEGRYTSLNRAGERASGYARDEMMGMSWKQMVAPEYFTIVSEMLLRKLAGQETMTFYEVEMIAKTGRRIPLEVNSQIIYEDGQPVGVQGIARDITERKRAESLLRARFEREAESEKMRSLGQLSAGVAHNFNNALAAVLGRTQLLLRSVTDERHRRSLEVIETATQDAAEIVRRIQTFARRATPAQFNKVSLAALVTDAVQLTRTSWEDDAHVHGLRYDVTFTNEAGADDLVEANATEVREVFVNLIFNALDAMPAGGRIELREERRGAWLVVEVRDTGEGIPPEFHDRIFEPFFTTKGSQGSGLGLAVSYGIIKRHGGTIEARNATATATTAGDDGGTVFTIKFPHRQALPETSTG